MSGVEIFIILLIVLLISTFIGFLFILVGIGLFFYVRSRKEKQVQRVDHIAFQVSDLDEAIDFYTRQLGFSLKFRKNNLKHHEVFAFIQIPGCNLELIQLLDEENQPVVMEDRRVEPPFCPHIAIETDDVEKLIHEFDQKRIPLATKVLEIPGKVKWFYIHDLDKNIIEYVQWLT